MTADRPPQSPSVPPPSTASNAPSTGGNPVFAHRRGGRKIAVELQWGLILGAVLGFVANLALTIGFTWWPVATNLLVGKVYPQAPALDGIGWVGYAASGGLLIAGVVWGILWRRWFRCDFQEKFRL